jgi:hypothetical protein
MQSHYVYLWNVAENVKVQLDAIAEERQQFQYVCPDATRRFDEVDRLNNR